MLLNSADWDKLLQVFFNEAIKKSRVKSYVHGENNFAKVKI